MTVPIDPREHENPAPGGGWISGPSLDPRPTYSPHQLIIDICQALARAGIKVNPAPNQLYVAGIACADVLRGLGVRPENSPER